MLVRCPLRSSGFFFNDTATTEIYTLSLHDALPISLGSFGVVVDAGAVVFGLAVVDVVVDSGRLVVVSSRSEEHTSELQSHSDLVCRLLLEKKKNKNLSSA